MPRETPVYTVGDYWLTKRRDGKSPDTWQIARYAEKSRSVVYRSTKRSSLEDAKVAIHAHVERERSKSSQSAEVAKVLPQLDLYWREHGAEAISAVTIGGSLRNFMAFLMQDQLGVHVTVAELKLEAFDRFRRWLMGPHAYDLDWKGRNYKVDSPGLRGESAQRNFNDIRAALNHAVARDRIPYAPKVPSVPDKMRSPPRDVQLSIAQMGAAVGFVAQGGHAERGTLRWLLLMIATAVRPDAALAFDPKSQDKGNLLDLHPESWPRTKKHNPVVPTIEPMRTVLDMWAADPHRIVGTRRTGFRTIRRALGWPDNVVPKTIRHSIATELRKRGVPFEDEIRPFLGHRAATGVTAVYAKYDPAYLAKASAALTTIFEEVIAAAAKWAADHQRTKIGNDQIIVVARKAQKH